MRFFYCVVFFLINIIVGCWGLFIKDVNFMVVII